MIVQKNDAIDLEEFRTCRRNILMPAISGRSDIIQLQYHLFDTIDLYRPDAQGVEDVEKDGKDNHAAFKISNTNGLD